MSFPRIIRCFSFTLLLLGSTNAYGQEVDSSRFEPASPIPSISDVLPLPSWLSLEAGYVTEPVLVMSNEVDPLWNYAHGAELALQLSTGFAIDAGEEWREIDHWIFTLDIQQYSDTGDFAGAMGVVSSPQEINNPSGVYLGELSLTRSNGAGWFYAKIGSISMDADFLSPDAPGYYTNASFNNQYNVSVDIFPISPMISYGGVVGVQLPKNIMIKSGVYQLSQTRSDFANFGWDWSTTASDGLIEVVQISGGIGEESDEASICPPDDHTFSRHASECGDEHVFNELPGGGWQVGGFFGQYEADETASSIERENNNGIYANLTVPVPLSIGVGHRFWVSVMNGFHPSLNPVPLWIGSGWMSQGIFEKRPLDLILLGVSYSQFSPDEEAEDELIVELDYSAVLTDSISIQPSVQYFINTPSDIALPLTVGVGIQIGL